MKSQITVLGCGAVGIQTAVYLLEQFVGEVLLYDSDTDYAKGMTLDCMQAAAVRDWQGSLNVVESINDLEHIHQLIVTDANTGTLDTQWIECAKKAQCTILASSDERAISQAVQAGVAENRILDIRGLVDSRILAEVIAHELQISITDVHVMVYGGVGTHMQSKADFVRVHGIPVNYIQEGLFEKALAKAKEQMPYKDAPWGPHYTFAAAAVETALIMESGMNAIVPITTQEGTIPALIGNYAVQKTYKELIEGDA